MKEWFKYEFGYVNIDSQNIYFTSSGNWSETKNLKEKSKEVERKHHIKSSKHVLFLILTGLVLSFILFKSIDNGKVSLTLILLIPVGGYKLYNYLKTEIGTNHKIPLAKINEIKIKNNSAEIIFLNSENSSDYYNLTLVEEKGMKILENLNTVLKHQQY